MSQQLVTNYYKAGKSPAARAVNMNTPPKRHRLSLNRSVTPVTPSNVQLKTEIDDKNNIVHIISSDDENGSILTPLNLSQTSVASDDSDKTVIYSPQPPCKLIPTPSTQFTRPASTSKQSSPSKRGRFYSPTKKRSVPLKSPQRTPLKQRYMANSSRKLFEDNADDKSILNACDGVDDKTKFLINDINNLLKEPALRKLLDVDSVQLLTDYFLIPKLGMKLVCRLYWRKEGWHRLEDIHKICSLDKNDLLDEAVAREMLDALVEKKFLVAGSNNNLTFKQYASILKADDLKEICKDLKLKTQTKKNAVEVLQEYCRSTSITRYFTNNNGDTSNHNRKRVLQIMATKAGPCYTLSELARGTLLRLHVLTYLGVDFELIRERRLELALLNEKTQRETYPVRPDVCRDSAGVVFHDADEFERYMFAHQYYENFLSETSSEARCHMARQVHNLYRQLSAQHLERYSSLPSWLQRFTPAGVYVRLLSSSLGDLKRGKLPDNCRLAVEVLGSLLGQPLRPHSRAEWYDEKALLLHSYLKRPDEAAQVLLEAFESSLPAARADRLRARARRLARHRALHADVRRALAGYAAERDVREDSVPARHLRKQPVENTTKGKALYETRSSQGRVVQGVEEHARTRYLQSGTYTHGEHWEGRMVTSIFFLLFWDVIYSPPAGGARGVFLSRLQRYPLDLWSDHFYPNRKEAIEKRLAFVEGCGVEQMLECMRAEWERRPEHELSGISRQLGWDNVRSVSRCLGPARVAAICRRLAADYRYTHSGFPDLTLWHEGTGVILFAEVKSDSDSPSVKQIQWLQYLVASGCQAEFCYVGARTTRVRARGAGGGAAGGEGEGEGEGE